MFVPASFGLIVGVLAPRSMSFEKKPDGFMAYCEAKFMAFKPPTLSAFVATEEAVDWPSWLSP